MRNTCIEMNGFDRAQFLSASGLVILEWLTDVDMWLMVEKGIRGGICHTIYHYAKVNNKYMEDYDQNK